MRQRSSFLPGVVFRQQPASGSTVAGTVPATVTGTGFSVSPSRSASAAAAAAAVSKPEDAGAVDDADIAAGQNVGSPNTSVVTGKKQHAQTQSQAQAHAQSYTQSLSAAANPYAYAYTYSQETAAASFQLQQQQQQQQQSMSSSSYFPSNMNSSSNNNNNNNTSSGAMYYKAESPKSSSTATVCSTTSSSKLASPPSSVGSSINLPEAKRPPDLDFFEDLVSEPVLVLGMDISHLSRRAQFLVCASGVFCFSLLYGYLQELISVSLCSRRLGLFLAMIQFSGYTVLAYILRNFVYQKQQRTEKLRQEERIYAAIQRGDDSALDTKKETMPTVPLVLYLGLSLLRAVDLAMTNMAMQYINYPAKTLMKSSRVVFTMLFGVLVARKTYKLVDYAIVLAMVAGLALFMHADANSSAVFHHLGVVMLTVSLTCDGAISNISETIMSKFGVGQDEFIFRMYSIALVAITAAAAVKGDLREGFYWMTQPGTYDEMINGHVSGQPQWSVAGKIAVITLFSSMGFFGSSCSAAITKNFGALTMSITSTARKATTLFLSFFLFNNVCTAEHLVGVFIFIAALTTKSLRRGRHDKKNKKSRRRSTHSQRRSGAGVHQHSSPTHVHNQTIASQYDDSYLIQRSMSSSPQKKTLMDLEALAIAGGTTELAPLVPSTSSMENFIYQRKNNANSSYRLNLPSLRNTSNNNNNNSAGNAKGTAYNTSNEIHVV